MAPQKKATNGKPSPAANKPQPQPKPALPATLAELAAAPQQTEKEVERLALRAAKYFDVVFTDGDKLTCKLVQLGQYHLLVEAFGELAGDEIDGLALLSKAAIKAIVFQNDNK